MNREDAVEAARAFLQGIYGDGPPTIVIDPAEAMEYPLAWAVLFNTQEAIDTGDITQAPIMRVVDVFKDGSHVDFRPSAYTVEQSNNWLATRQRPQREPWPKEVDPSREAEGWLRRQYRGRVELATLLPIAEGPELWVFSCRARPVAGYADTPMLASLVAVPKNGVEPFHPATDEPWDDMRAFDQDPRPRDPAVQARRLNARGCVIAADAFACGARAVALPWRPANEAPGWWERLTGLYFPGAEVSICGDWNQVTAAMAATGPGTRGVVWIRRELNFAEATGHLLYAHNKDGQVVFLDPQAGRLARLETVGIRQLTLARCAPPAEPPVTGPRTAAEAITMAKAAGHGWYRPDGTAGPLRAEEFSHGFAVYLDKPPIDGPQVPQYGGGLQQCMVVDKADGHVTMWPHLSVEGIARLYLRDGRYTGLPDEEAIEQWQLMVREQTSRSSPPAQARRRP